MKYYTLKHKDNFVKYCGLDGSLCFVRGNILVGDNLSDDFDYLNDFADFWNKHEPFLKVEVVEVKLFEVV
jgi:hypothetical protein